MSSSGSELTDSTGMPSLATSDSASTPPIRSLMRLSCSRNMGAGSPGPAQARQVALQQIGLARDRRRLRSIHAGEQLRRVERAVAAAGGACQLGQCLARGVVAGLAPHDPPEDASPLLPPPPPPLG